MKLVSFCQGDTKFEAKPRGGTAFMLSIENSCERFSTLVFSIKSSTFDPNSYLKFCFKFSFKFVDLFKLKALCSVESNLSAKLCSGEPNLTAISCSGESNLTATSCSGESHLTATSCSGESILTAAKCSRE